MIKSRLKKAILVLGLLSSSLMAETSNYAYNTNSLVGIEGGLSSLNYEYGTPTNNSIDKIFISHFSNAISKKLLPLYFTPNPDSYTNIVFYVNDSGVIYDDNPSEPEFEEIERSGFTAVEISYIIRR